MSRESWSKSYEPAMPLGPTQVCADLQEDLPVLRVWSEQNEELVHLELSPIAARKLVAQLTGALVGVDWEGQAAEEHVRVHRKGRLVAIVPTARSGK